MKLRQFLWRNIFWQGGYLLLAFVLNLLMARKFGAAINGHLNYLQFLFSIVILVGGISLESGLIYFGASQRIPKTALGFFALVFSLLVTAVIAFVLYGTDIFNNGDLNIWFAWCVLYVGGYLFINNFSALFYAERKVVIPNMIKSVITVILIIGLINYQNFYGEFWSNEFLWLYFISFFVMGLTIMIAWLINTAKERPYLSFPAMAEMKELLRYALLALVTNIVFFLVYRVDYWFVDKYCDEQALGNYTQVSKWVQYFQVLPMFMATALFPAAAAGMLKENLQDLKRISRMMFWMFMVILVPLAIVSPWFFVFMYGETYNQMSLPFILLLPGILSLSMISLLGAYYAGVNMIRVNLVANLIALVIIVAGNSLFTPRYGIKAAALLSSVGYLSCAAWQLRIFLKDESNKLSDLLAFRLSDYKNLLNK